MRTSGFDFAMIRRLLFKDFYIHRWPIAVLLLSDALILFVVGSLGEKLSFRSPQSLQYYASSQLFPLVLTFGIHVTTVFEENKTFLRSLPIRIKDYTAAKLAINLLLILPAWATLSFREMRIVAERAVIPDGLIPYFALVPLASLACFCVALGITTRWGTRGFFALLPALILAPVFFPQFLDRMPAIRRALLNDSAVWTPVELGILVLLLATIGLTFFLIFHFQERRKDFTCSDF